MLPSESSRNSWTLLWALVATLFVSVQGMALARRSCSLFARNFGFARRPNIPARMASTLPEFEVEQKFTLGSLEETEKRLKELGFEKSPNQVHMVDWYWEDAWSQWTLTCQDCWLRLRQALPSKKAGWQLKVRRPVSGNTAATVYEEIGGPEAIQKALALLPSDISAATAESQDLLQLFLKETEQPIPEEMMQSNSQPRLFPFARIETKRSSWIPSATCPHSTLKVDLDTAIYSADNSIYTVGEVEEVVHSQEDVVSAKERVEIFIGKLTGTESTAPSIGKLEYYLMNHRPEHFQALVDSGILNN